MMWSGVMFNASARPAHYSYGHHWAPAYVKRGTTVAGAMEAFAETWTRNWNANDLEALLAHYRDDARFTSPRARTLTGSAYIHGKEALRNYWSAAIARSTHRHFSLERTVQDMETSELVILYISETSLGRLRACESFRFDVSGLVIEGEAFYGAEV